MIRRSNHINSPIFYMIQCKVLKRLSKPMINLLHLVLNLSWWNFGFPKRRRNKRERRKRINKSTNLLATYWILPEPTHILLNNNPVKVILCKVVLKAKVWCLTNTTKEAVLVLKEVATVVAEVAQEEVTEAVTWVAQAVINNNMHRDHLNNQVLSHSNNSIPNSNNNKSPNNNLEWLHVASTQLWECLSNSNSNQFNCCLFLKLIWLNSSQSPIPTRRNNLLVTLSIQISNKLSVGNLLVRSPVCWLMRTLWISHSYSLTNNTLLRKPGKPWVC